MGSLPRFDVAPLVYPKVNREEGWIYQDTREVPDPYRRLEDPKAEATKSFVENQVQLTKLVLSTCDTKEKLRERITASYDYPKFSCPYRRGNKYIYTLNTGLQAQSVVYMQDTLYEDGEALLDPNTLSDDGTISLTGEGESAADRPLPNSEDKIMGWDSLLADIDSWIKYKGLFRRIAQYERLKVLKDLIYSKELHDGRGNLPFQEGNFLTPFHFFVENGIWQCAGYDSTVNKWRGLPLLKSTHPDQLPHPDPDLFKEYSVCGTSGVHCANVGEVLEGLIDSKELHNGRGNVHFQEGNLLTTSYFPVKDDILQSETEYVCVDTKASKSFYCNLQRAWKEGVMSFNIASIPGVAKAILTAALVAISTPMVGAIAPEAATAQGTLEAGKFEKSFNLGTGVVGIIGVVVTTVGVGVAINECRRRKQRAITAPSSTAPIGNMVNRTGKLLQTHIVKRWRIFDFLHYEYVQRSEELV